MGGWTMLEYAVKHPDRVKALVLSSTSGTLDRRGSDPSAKAIHPAVGASAAARWPALHLLYRSIDEMAGALDKAKLRDGLRRTATRTFADLATFRVPTLLIAGGEDVVFPAFLASAIAARLPCGEAEIISDSGHSPYFEQAARFNELVDAFLVRQR